jgi:predicted Rossmann fold nucleotide-binding protein DprA/Smf involved in DNA uptake
VNGQEQAARDYFQLSHNITRELFNVKNSARAYLASAGTFIPHWLLARAEISHGAKLTCARLAQNVDARGMVRSHLAKLAAHLGREVQQVMLFLIELEKSGLIEIQGSVTKASSLCCLLPDHP